MRVEQNIHLGEKKKNFYPSGIDVKVHSSIVVELETINNFLLILFPLILLCLVRILTGNYVKHVAK